MLLDVVFTSPNVIIKSELNIGKKYFLRNKIFEVHWYLLTRTLNVINVVDEKGRDEE